MPAAPASFAATHPGIVAATALALAAGERAAQAGEGREARVADVVVTATRVPQAGFDLPAAIDAIGAEGIAGDRPQVNLSESLGPVPGVLARTRENYAQDLQVSVRGFGARAGFGVRGVRLVADGIPATMPDGQGQAASFSLSSAARIEVLRGPLAALYGNASGGIVQVFTADGPAEPELAASAWAGSHRSYRAGLAFGGQAGGLNYIGDASRFSTAGYREHGAARREQFNAKLSAPAAGGKLTLVASALDQPRSEDPLGLTRTRFEEDPRQADPAALLFDARKSVRQGQLGAVYDLVLAGGDTLQARLYGGGRTVLQFLAQPGAGPLASGGVVDLDRRYGGAGLRWTRNMFAMGSPLALSAGVEFDRLDERRRGYVNEAGTQGALQRDEDDIADGSGAYALAEWQPAGRWSVLAGVRHSRVDFDSRDRYVTQVNPDDSGRVAYARTVPVAGVVYKPSPQWRVYASAGEGFETPTFTELAYRPGGETGLNLELRPSTSRQAEAGLKARFGERGRAGVSVFRIDTRDEIVVNASTGGRTDYRNAARTRRDGLELALEGGLGAGFEASLAWTWLDARFVEAFASGTPPVTVPAGARLPGVPKSVLHAGLAWRHAASGFHAAAEVRAASRVYVNDANTDAAEGYAVADLRLGFEQRVGAWRLRQFLRVDNATDRRYAGSVIVAEARERYFEPGAGRTAMIGITAVKSF